MTERQMTLDQLTKRQKEICKILRRQGQIRLAEAYERLSLHQFAARNGYMIVDKHRKRCGED